MPTTQSPREPGTFAAQYLPISIVGALTTLLVAEMPVVPAGARTMLILLATAFLLVLWATCREYREPVLATLRRVPNLFVVLLLAWSAAAFFLSPYRGYATLELLRVLAGFAVYTLTGFALPRRYQPAFVAGGLILVGCAIALYDALHLGQMASLVVGDGYSLLGTHENIATLLVLLFPFALAFALAPVGENRVRTSALVAMLLLGAALLLSRTRTAWIAGLFSLIVMGIVLIRWQIETLPQTRSSRARLSALIGSPLVPVLIGFTILIAAGGLLPLLKARANINTALEDVSLSNRLMRWRSAARMASEKPITGWGLGTWTVAQGQWTHQGDEVADVLAKGTGHENIAHNYYVQWAGEAGGVGVALYVAVMVGFLLTALREQGRVESPVNRALLIGCVGAVAAGLVDAIGSPGYNVPGEYSVLWAALGLGMAAMRDDGRSLPDRRPTPSWIWTTAVLIGLGVAAGITGWGVQQREAGKKLPLGKLVVRPDAGNMVPAGTLVRWETIFTDANGIEQSTIPGTEWSILADTPLLQDRETQLMRVVRPKERSRSALQMRLPAGSKPATILVTYKDDFGRAYQASSVVGLVRNRAATSAAKP